MAGSAALVHVSRVLLVVTLQLPEVLENSPGTPSLRATHHVRQCMTLDPIILGYIYLVIRYYTIVSVFLA